MKIIIIDDSSAVLRDMRFNLEYFFGHEVLTIGFNQKPPLKEHEVVFQEDGALFDLYTNAIDDVVFYVREHMPDLILVDHQIHRDENNVSGFHIVQKLPDMIERIIGIGSGGGQSYCGREFCLKSQLARRPSSESLQKLTEAQQFALDQLAAVIGK